MGKKIDLASDRLDAEQLKRAVRGNPDKAGLALANPNLDTRCLVYLARFVDIGSSPVVQKRMSKRFIEQLIADSHDGCFVGYCSNREMLESIVDLSINDDYFQYCLPSYIGRNPHLTETMVERLLTIDKPFLHKNLARNPVVPDHYLDRFADDIADVRVGLASRPDLPERLAVKLATDKVERVLFRLQNNETLNAAGARALILNSCKVQKAGAALRELYDEDPRFAALIRKQPACDAALKADIDTADLPTWSLAKLKSAIAESAVAADNNIDVKSIKTAKALTDLYKSRPDLGQAIVRNPACGKPLLKKLLADNIDIGLNPRVQLELMMDDLAIKAYFPKGFTRIERLAAHSPCQAALRVIQREMFSYENLYALARNPNVSADQREEGIVAGYENFLRQPGLEQSAVDRWFEHHLHDIHDYEYTVRDLHASYQIPGDLFAELFQRIYLYICSDRADSIREYEAEALKRDGSPSLARFREHESYTNLGTPLAMLEHHPERFADVEPILEPLHGRVYAEILARRN